MSPHKSCAAARRTLGASDPSHKPCAAPAPSRESRAVSALATPPHKPRAAPSLSIGERVEVFWPKQDRWYQGVVSDVGNGRYRVKYDIDNKEHSHCGDSTQVRSMREGEECDEISLLLGTPPGGWSDEN